MKASILFLSFLFISHECTRQVLADVQLDGEPIFTTFFRENLTQSLQFFRKNFAKYLGYTIVAHKSQEDILTEIYTMQSSFLEDNNIPSIEKEFLIKILKTHISKGRYIMKQKNQELTDLFANFAKSVLVRIMKNKMDDKDQNTDFKFGELLTKDDFRQVFLEMFNDEKRN